MLPCGVRGKLMTILRVRRREFVAALGCAAAWPLVVGDNERRSLFCSSPFAVLMAQSDCEDWVSPRHGSKFHERCNFTDRLFL
jgi:hypothetical protein